MFASVIEGDFLRKEAQESKIMLEERIQHEISRKSCKGLDNYYQFNPYPFFWDHHRACFLGKKSKAETYTNLLNAALWIFFPQNTLGHGPAFWIFFQDSRIRVN